VAEWSSLLGAFNSLMRAKQRRGLKTTVDEFFDIVNRVRLHSRRRSVSEVLDLLWRAKPHADDFQARLMDDPDQLPALDPLIASLVSQSDGGTKKSDVQSGSSTTGKPCLLQSESRSSLKQSHIPFPSLPGSHPRYISPQSTRSTRSMSHGCRSPIFLPGRPGNSPQTRSRVDTTIVRSSSGRSWTVTVCGPTTRAGEPLRVGTLWGGNGFVCKGR
jgi:hypothetical protein